MTGSRRRGRSLTRLGAWALTAAATLVALALLRGDVWLYLLAAVCVSAVAVNWLLAPRLAAAMGIHVGHPVTEVVGRTSTYEVSLVAKERTPRRRETLHVAEADPVSFVVGPLEAGERVVARVEVTGAVRGEHTAARMLSATSLPFGLVRVARRAEFALPRTVGVPVRPVRVPLRPGPGDGASSTTRISRAGSDVHALRAWNPGDGTAIHWRATARRGSPVVADREIGERTSLVVLVGPASGPEAADAVVGRAAGVALAAAAEGADVHLLDAGGTTSVPPGAHDLLVRWTARAQPLSVSGESLDRAVRAAGAGAEAVLVQDAAARLDRTGLEQAAAARGLRIAVMDVEVPVPDDRPAPPRPVPPSSRLRTATIASLVSGLVGLAAAGVIAAPVAGLWSLALVGVGLLGLRRPDLLEDPRVRTSVTLAICAVIAVVALVRVQADALPDAAATALAGLAVAQTLAQRTRRDALVGLGLGPVMVVTAAGLAPTPALVLPVVLSTVIGLVGLAVAADDSLDEGAVVLAPTRPSRAGTSLTVSITAVVATALTAFLLLPLGSAPALGASLLSAGSSDPSASELAASTQPAFVGAPLDLAARGHLSDDPAFQVRAGGPALWRAQTLDSVFGGVWQSSRSVDSLLQADADGRISLEADAAELGAPRGKARTYDVRPIGIGNNSLIAPGPVTSVRGLTSVQQATPDLAFNLGEPASFTVTATPRPSIDDVASAVAGGTDQSDERYLELDGATTDRTRALAVSITVGVGDRVAQVRAVEAYLRGNVRYRLDAAAPPEGQDAVDFLLFDSHEGFCQHFAAAEVTLLRSLGIPSRMATGYAIGGPADRDGWLTAKASDAHAWVEVWVPGHGWVTSDPTAGATLAPAEEPSLLARISSAWTSLWTSDESRRRTAAGLLVLVALGLSLRRLVRRARARVVVSPSSPGSARQVEPLPAFARLRAALESTGTGLAPADGVGEVRRACPGDPALARALDVVERCLYDRAPVATADRIAATEVLDSRTAALLSAVPAGAGR